MTNITPTALITGASQRIGKTIALFLASQGWSLILHYRTPGRMQEETLKAVEATGVKVTSVRADLAKEEEVATLFSAIPADFGPVTCLINNAAHFENDTLKTMTRGSWDIHLETNLRAPIVLIQQFAKQLPTGAYGNIINILDYCVWNYPDHFFSYTLSKSTLWTATQILALELAPFIRINAIGPGPTLANSRQSQQQFIESLEHTPLKRGSSPEEICKTIGFILSMPSMTGQMIALDGGRHLSDDPYT